MSITKECMVVNLQIGTWLGYRLDKEASRRVTTDAAADKDAARVNKHIVPRETLKPIVTAANAVRGHFYDKTLPWKDNGDRLLTRKMYMTFVEEHEALVTTFNTEVATFLKETYPVAISRAEFRMGALFRIDDYPPSNQLARRFYVHLDIDPVSEAGDFRVAMDDAEQDLIRSRIEEATKARLASAMGDVWERLSKTVGHFAERMEGDSVFRDSTVNNLNELVEMLPALNILDDPNIERIHQQLVDKIAGIDPKDLRKDEGVRKAAAAESKRIMADMQGFMKAFENAA